MKYVWFSVIKNSKTQGVKPNTRERKLRSCVNWEGAFKQNKALNKGCVDLIATRTIRGKKYVVSSEL